jgi:hypothetical protein
VAPLLGHSLGEAYNGSFACCIIGLHTACTQAGRLDELSKERSPRSLRPKTYIDTSSMTN